MKKKEAIGVDYHRKSDYHFDLSGNYSNLRNHLSQMFHKSFP